MLKEHEEEVLPKNCVAIKVGIGTVFVPDDDDMNYKLNPNTRSDEKIIIL